MATTPLNFDKHTFRCSSLGKIMTEPQGKSNMDLYLEAKDKLAEFREKESAKIDKLKGEVEAFPEEKRTQKGYINLEAKYKKAEADFETKVLALSSELKKAEAVKDEIQLSKTCTSHLIEIFVQEKYNRRKELNNKYIKKGNKMEEEAISLLSELEDSYFEKNCERKYDEFFNGECDIDDTKPNKITWDTKCSWSIHTFMQKTVAGEIDMDYWWQGQGYMELFGANRHILTYMLLNTPPELIDEEKKRLLYQMGRSFQDSQVYKEACDAIAFENTYDDIPLAERTIKISFAKDEDAISRARLRVIACRKWLNQYSQEFFERTSLNKEILYVPKHLRELAPPPALAVPAQVVITSETNLNITPESEDRIKNIITDVLDNAIENGLSLSDTESAMNTAVQEQIKPILESEGVDTSKFNKEVAPGVVQRDIEDQIAEVKAEIQPPLQVSEEVVKVEDAKPEPIAGMEYEHSLQRIEKCESQGATLDLYKQLLPLFDKYPDLKEKLKAKKDSFTEKEIETKQKESPKRVAAPAPAAPPRVEDDDEDEEEEIAETNPLLIKLNACKTHMDVSALYNENKDEVDNDAKIKIQFIEIGKRRKTHPLQ